MPLIKGLEADHPADPMTDIPPGANVDESAVERIESLEAKLKHLRAEAGGGSEPACRSSRYRAEWVQAEVARARSANDGTDPAAGITYATDTTEPTP